MFGLSLGPFLRPDATAYDDIFTDGVVTVLGDRGLDALSVGAVARWMGQTPQAVLKHARGRDRFVAMVTECFTMRWVAWSTLPGPTATATGQSSFPGPSLPGPLPVSAEERHGVRVWHALTELAHGELLAGRLGPAQSLTRARERERWVMRAALEGYWGQGSSETEVDAALALIAGLRLLMTAPDEPLSPERAEAVLSGWLSTTNPSVEAGE